MPSQHLVDEVVSRIEGSHPKPGVSFARLGLAGVAAAVMLMVFAAFGGVGLAASGVSGAASSTAQAVSELVKPNQSTSGAATSSTNSRQGDNGNGDGDGDGNGNGNKCEDDDDDGAKEGEYCKPRVTICHVRPNGKQKTLTLPARAAARHLNNHPNDRPGPCRNGDGDGGDD